jgi:hypothetical protein
MFGNNVKVMIYSSWLKSDAAKHGILGDPEGFASLLRELFGIAGSTVEVLFVREIRKRFVIEIGLTLPPSSESFPTLIREIRMAGRTETAT